MRPRAGRLFGDRLRDPSRGPPRGPGHDGLGDHPVPIPLDHREHGLDQGLGEVVRLEAQVEEAGARPVLRRRIDRALPFEAHIAQLAARLELECEPA